MKITVDWGQITSEEEFYDKLLLQLMAPPWHGKNLDALADSLVTGDINGIEPPYTIHNKNVLAVDSTLSIFQHQVFEVFNEAVNAERRISVSFE